MRSDVPASVPQTTAPAQNKTTLPAAGSRCSAPAAVLFLWIVGRPRCSRTREGAHWSWIETQRIKEGAGAICQGRERYESSLRERQGTYQASARCFPDTHRPNSRTPNPIRLGGLRTIRRLLQCPTRLPEQRPAQRAPRARTLRFTASQDSPDAGFFTRFAFLRASSCFCQSWTGTASGEAARSSHRSSTSWSFSEGLRSKIDAEFIRISTANSLKFA